MHVTVNDAGRGHESSHYLRPESRIDFTLRWVKEFDVKDRIKGEPLVLNMNFAL